MPENSPRKWKTLRTLRTLRSGESGTELGFAEEVSAPPDGLPEATRLPSANDDSGERAPLSNDDPAPQSETPEGVVSAVGVLPVDSPAEPAEPPTEGGDSPELEPDRVLLVLPVASTARLIRETLENFTKSQVETTPNSLRGFELALQKPYRLFIFGMESGELSGPMLYELICSACAVGRGPRRLAPAVVFIREKGDPQLPEELARDARVKDVVSKPIRIERLLRAVRGPLEVHDPTSTAREG